jgi:peptidyl-prolyl cis-trans isomerase B (cyclophilin B)
MKLVLTVILLTCSISALSQPIEKIKKGDLKKDVRMITTKGIMTLRLSDSTPIHRDNFIKLIKTRYFEDIIFHRVISGFMIQAGDESTKTNYDSSKKMNDYTIPAEFKPTLFHKRGVLAAARMGDNVNPLRASSGVQFYIVQGRTFNDHELDSIEINRLEGVKLPAEHRSFYKKTGGTPQLDQHYTVFGELINGFDVLDTIASVKTTGKGKGDKPIDTIRILKARLVRRVP